MRNGIRSRRKAERPVEILAAAFEEFVAKGFTATRLDDVATRVGVTKGTLYLYFDSKESLFVACLIEAMRPVLDNLGSLASDLRGPAFDLLRRHFVFVADKLVGDRKTRELVRLLIAEGARFPEVVRRWQREFIDPAQDAFARIGGYGVERGEFNPAAVDMFAYTAMAPVLLANHWLIVFGDDPAFDVDAFFAATLELYAVGLLKVPVDQDLLALQAST